MIDLNTSPDKLRKSILQEAMQGKLTQQLPEDGDAANLLQSIAEEKQRLYKTGKIKKPKRLATITDDEIPFKIPDNWEWLRLGDISLINTGNTPSKKHKEYYNSNDIEFVTPKDINNSYVKNADRYISSKALNKARIAIPHSIFVVGIGDPGRVGIATKKSAFNQQLHNIYPLLCLFKYIYYCLMSNATQKQFKDSTGTVINIINKTRCSNIIVPIPPLREQKRIVTKLDSLLPKVDSFKQSVNHIQTLRSELPPRLRRSFLQEAMQGKLTQQLPEDGDAANLLQSIAKKKQQLIQAGKIKKSKQLAAITDDDIPFKIPDNWQWVKLANITNIIMGQSPKSKFVYEGIPDNSHFEFHQGKSFFGDKIIQKSNKVTEQYSRLINDNYILMSVRAPVGDINMTNREIDLGRGLCGISPIGFSKLYLYYYLRTQKAPLMKKATGSTFKAINKKVIFNELIPLPPLAEQKRIVKKLDLLFSKIYKIE